MADNLTTQTTNLATVPDSSTIATDDVGGVHYQKVKLDVGGDGATVASKATDALGAPETGILAVGTGPGWTRTASGTLGSLNATVSIDTDGASAALFQVLTGSTLLGTVIGERTVNGTTWVSAEPTDGYTIHSGGFTDPGAGMTVALDGAGALAVRLRVSLYTSGSASIVAATTSANNPGLNIQRVALTDGGTSGFYAALGGGTQASALRSTEATDSPVTTSLQIIDDIVYTDDTSTHATGTSKGALLMAAATPTDGSVNANDIGAVAMTIDRKMHVSVQDALPAGTNAIGKLAANSGVDIGDVDVTSLPALVAGTANIGDVDVLTVPAPLSTTGTGTAATALRTVSASDSPDVTSLQLIDDAVYADDAARSKSLAMGAVLDDVATTAITENQAGYLRMSTRRALLVEGVASGTAQPISAASLPLPTGAATSALQTQPGVDIGDVTINNAAGASAVNIQDGGNSVTVDAPNGTPVFARLTDATLNVGVVDETGASAVDALAVGGGTANDAVDSGNPLKIGGKATTVVPTAVAAADRVNSWFDVYGRHLVQQGVPLGTERWVTKQYTGTQTGDAFLTPTSGKKLVITYVQIQVGGTTAGTMQLWFGGSADTSYTRGTDRAIFDGEFAPSATLKPGFTATKESGWVAAAADDILRVTTSAAINPLTVTVWGYEV